MMLEGLVEGRKKNSGQNVCRGTSGKIYWPIRVFVGPQKKAKKALFSFESKVLIKDITQKAEEIFSSLLIIVFALGRT